MPAPPARPPKPDPIPLQVVLGPVAAITVERAIAAESLKGVRVIKFVGGAPPVLTGPTVLVLAAEDLKGRSRGTLLHLAEAARPGRPILIGGTRNRDLLLEAINQWRVFRILSDDVRPAVLIDAVTKAHALAVMESELNNAAVDLEVENTGLAEAVRALQESQARLRHLQRLATLGRVTSGLIPVIAGHLAALQEFNILVGSGVHRRDPRLEELLGYAVTGVRTLDAMLDEIRNYAESRPEVLRLDVEDVDALARFAVAFSSFDPLIGSRTIRADFSSGARIRGDCFRLYQVLINLIRNAFQAAPPQGNIVVRTSIDGDHAVIDVENDGPPIPDEIKARLFQPFFSTKGANGLGLGLAMCRTTIERHGGSISVQSEEGENTRFRIRLPLDRPRN